MTPVTPVPPEAGAAGGAGSEPVEVVDPQGEVVGVVTRAEMRSRRLRHRCTYIAVVGHDEQLVVHRRAEWKDVWPGRWDLAFGGVAGVGESWAEAAGRELAEEAGLRAELVEIGGGLYEDSDVSVLGRVYLARHDGPVRFADGEVTAVDRIALAELEEWLASRSTCPDSVALVVPALLSGPSTPGSL